MDLPPALVLHKAHQRATSKAAESIENVLANHTANKPQRRLCVSYAVQSLRTGLPILLVDMVVTSLCLLLACWVVNFSQGHTFNLRVWKQVPVALLFQWVLFSLHQLYPGAGISSVAELRGIVRSTCVSFFCLSTVNIIFGELPRIEFVTFAFAAIAVAGLLPIARGFSRRLLSKTSWWGLRVLLIGNRDQCRKTVADLKVRRWSGFVPVGYTSGRSVDESAAIHDPEMLGTHDEAVEIACQHRAPLVGLVSSEAQSRWTDRLLFQFPSIAWLGHADSDDGEIDTSSLPEICVTHVNLPFLRLVPRFVKRATDLVIVIPALMLLAIPMLVVAAIIKVVAPGPVFYASPRIGQHGKPFKMWKFRTMVVDADKALQQKLAEDPAAREEWQHTQKLKNDPRIIGGVGKLMRRWSIDELPQLWNVLVGQMSLVGPRPVPENEIVLYDANYYEYTQMWPGITGLWQVSGRNETNFDTRVFLVRHYAKNWSPWLDAWILMKTPPAVLTKRGAY
tara:strand:+ start:96016 stop:97536 length:1521 start_codon:yes stop_codon:yes gene_type:complete